MRLRHLSFTGSLAKHIGVTVDDLGAALEDLRLKGLADEGTQVLTKGAARFFFVRDPDGMWVEVIKDNRY
jgi:catechol 2,3-dioxygenase-like lactoylglutathione lyase family enzyme